MFCTFCGSNKIVEIKEEIYHCRNCGEDFDTPLTAEELTEVYLPYESKDIDELNKKLGVKESYYENQ